MSPSRHDDTNASAREDAPSHPRSDLSTGQAVAHFEPPQVRVSERLRAGLSTEQRVQFPIVELVPARGPHTSTHPHPYALTRPHFNLSQDPHVATPPRGIFPKVYS